MKVLYGTGVASTFGLLSSPSGILLRYAKKPIDSTEAHKYLREGHGKGRGPGLEVGCAVGLHRSRRSKVGARTDQGTQWLVLHRFFALGLGLGLQR